MTIYGSQNRWKRSMAATVTIMMRKRQTAMILTTITTVADTMGLIIKRKRL
jgi:hypothetical protein